MIHVRTVDFLAKEAQKQLDQESVLSNYHFLAGQNVPTENIPDIFGCTKTWNRKPDLRLDIVDGEVHAIRKLLAGEVTFRNGSFDKAVTVATSYLAAWTDIAYSLAIILNENEDNSAIDLIQILLFIRTMPAVSNPIVNVNSNYCRTPEVLLENTASNRTLGRLLDANVLKNMTYFRNDIDDPSANFELILLVEEICDLTELNRDDFLVDYIRLDLREY